jgi:hypothetical protein
MKAKKAAKGRTVGRADRTRLSADESLKRMQAFGDRKESFIAAVRKAKGRSPTA